MAKSASAVVRCNSYDEEEVYNAVNRGIGLIGGPGSFMNKGEKILLKPNVLAGDKPERCVSTHPTIFRAAAQILKEAGARLYYGDSSGFGKPSSQMRKAELSQAAEALGIPLADFENGQEVSFPDSPFTKKFIIAKGVLESDGLISLPKLKTHQLTLMTGAVKNQFGCIPGILKAEYHVKMQNAFDFSRMLVALNLLLKPRLHIMDAVVAMEGNGPRSGDPVKMDVLIFSHDPVALDATACRLIDIDPEFVPTSKPGKEFGLGVYSSNEIELLGDPIQEFINTHFRVKRKLPESVTNNRGAISYIKNIVTPRPVIKKDRCICCGVCVEVCPVNPKALNWSDGERKEPPIYTYRNCIRCYCCQELCPERAIYVKTPLLERVIFRRY
jgi:uncharacterized protein (DUF362 family)/NAD-dependent dihydropyrimidine dehydrogenase PreA subunit